MAEKSVNTTCQETSLGWPNVLTIFLLEWKINVLETDSIASDHGADWCVRSRGVRII